MRKHYKYLIFIFYIFFGNLVFAQDYQIGNIFQYYYYIQHDVSPRSENKAIYGFNIYQNNVDVITLTSVCYTLGGTYNTSDIKPNGIKLWYSDNNYLNERAFEIANTSVVSPSNTVDSYNLCFLNNITIPGNNYGYIYLTVDIEESANVNSTFQVLGKPVVSIVGGNLISNNAQEDVEDIAIITFTSANLNKWSNPSDPIINISQNSKIKLFSIYHSTGLPISYNYEGMLVSMSGSALASDIDYFSLEFYDGYYGRRFVVSTISGVDVNGEILLPSTYKPSIPAWYGGYFELFAKINENAIVGNNLKVEKIEAKNLSISGTKLQGEVGDFTNYIINQSTATVSSIALTTRNIYKLINEPIYKFKLQNSKTISKLNTISFTVSGTNVASNSNGYSYLRYNIGSDNYDDSDYLQYSYYEYVNDNTLIFHFNSLNLNLLADNSYYFYFDYYSNQRIPVSGENIKVSSILLNNNSFESTKLSGRLNAGSTFNFATSNTSVSKVLVPSKFLQIDNRDAIYGTQIVVSNPGKSKLNFLVTLSGTFTDTDFNNLYIYSSKDNVFNLEDDTQVSNFYFTNQEDKTLTSYDFDVYSNSDKYYFIVFRNNSNSTSGNTIKVVDLNAYSYSGKINVNSNVNAGNIFTIKESTVSLSSSIQNINTLLNPMSNQSHFYSLKINVSNTGVNFNSFDYKIGGTILNYYYVYAYLSENGEFNPLINNYLSSTINYSPNVGDVERFNIYSNLKAGKDYYVHLAVYPYDYSSNVNRTIFIETFLGFSFGPSTLNISDLSGVLCTISSTLNVSPNTEVDYKNFALNSSQMVLLHSFKAISNSNRAISEVRYAIETNLSPNEILGYQLWKGSNIGDLTLKNINLVDQNPIISTLNGINLTFDGISNSVSSNEYEGYHLFAIINTSATGKSLKASLSNESILFDGLVFTSPQTITSPVVNSISPTVTVTSIPVMNAGFNPNGYNTNAIYKLAVVSNAVTRISEIVLSVSGSYTSSDFDYLTISQSNYQNGNNDYNVLYGSLSKSESTISGEYISFYPNNNQFNIIGDTLYIYIKARNKIGATLGREIQISVVSVIGIPSGNVILNTVKGNIFKIEIPEVEYTTIFPEGRKMHDNAYVNLASIKIDVKNSGVTFSNIAGITIKPIGDFSPNLYHLNARITKNPNSDFVDNEIVTENNSYYVSTISSYDFLQNVSLPVGTYYIHFIGYTYDMNYGSTYGLSISGLNFVNGSITGNGGVGNLMTISGNRFSIKSITLPKPKVLVGTKDAVFAAFMVSVTGADQFFTSTSNLETSGNYSGSDIAPNSIKIWKCNSNVFDKNTATLMSQYELNNGYLGAKETIQFDDIYRIFEEGVTYVYITADISANASSGKSIGLKNIYFSDLFNYSSSLTTYNDELLNFSPLTFATVSTQNIIWPAMETVSVTSLPTSVILNGFASSGLPISYVVNSGSATVNSNVLLVNAEGQFSITASQAGNEFFTAATPINQVINVVTILSPISSNNNNLNYNILELYPNPVRDILTIKGLKPNSLVEISDLVGNKIETLNRTNIINVSRYNKGIYFVSIYQDGEKVVKKLVIE